MLLSSVPFPSVLDAPDLHCLPLTDPPGFDAFPSDRAAHETKYLSLSMNKISDKIDP
jgi:hypothetical protein